MKAILSKDLLRQGHVMENLTCDAVEHQQNRRALRELLAGLPAAEPVQAKGASVWRGHNGALVVRLPGQIAQRHCRPKHGLSMHALHWIQQTTI